MSGAVFDWVLIDGKKPTTVRMSGTAMVTDTTEALGLALAGAGIAYIFEPLARRYVREGSLDGCSLRPPSNMMDYFSTTPRRASLAPELRAFIDVVKKLQNRLNEQYLPRTE